MTTRSLLALTMAALLGAAAPAALAQSSTAPAPKAEAPLPPEKNPPGDIPDTQVFVAYTSPKGYHLEVPEGWSRTVSADGTAVSLVQHYDGVSVTVAAVASAPTLASLEAQQVAALEANGRAVTVSSVEAVTLPAGPGFLVRYASNSEPNPVTDKQVRLENERFYLFHQGTLAALTLWAPYGSDNVDQWRRMSASFGWN